MNLETSISAVPIGESEISILQFIELNKTEIISRSLPNQRTAQIVQVLVVKRVIERLKQQFSTEQKYRLKILWETTHQLVRKEVKMQNQIVFNNFNLSQEEFQQMLKALQNGDETLFEKVFLSHFKACSRFLEDRFSASPTDAYDASMEALLKFHQRLKAGKISYGNLRYLFTQMAGQIYLKSKRLPQPQTLPDNFDIIDEPTANFSKETLAIFAQAGQNLCGDCRGLLQAFYYEKTPLIEIARKVDKTDVALRKQKQRCLEKLRKVFQKLA